MKYEGSEKRRCARIENTTFLMLFKNDDLVNSNWETSNTKNISCTGVLFATRAPFDLNANLNVRLQIPPANEYFSCKAKVIRCLGLNNNTCYEVAAALTNVDNDESGAFKQAIDYWLTKKSPNRIL